jgi:N-carbamoylputrescine amidase
LWRRLSGWNRWQMTITGKLRVALLQMVSHGLDQAANREKGDAFCRKAAQDGADLALFPEMWNVGYSLGDPAVWAGAITRSHPFYTHFQALARELKMAVALTFLEEGVDGPRNTLSLIDRTGSEVLAYSKVHTCAFDKEAPLVRGSGFPVATLATPQGEVQVGAMICYDREFPESARVLMLNGAELILTPNACELEPNRLGQYRTRAYENVLGLAMANYAAPQYNGHSVAYDGMAFDAQERTRDMVLVAADATEGVYCAAFDLDALRAYRAQEPMGSMRNVGAYERLVRR